MILTADKNQVTDAAYHTLNNINVGCSVVMVNWVENFVFNDALLGLKDYALICFCEYGYDWDMDKSGSHIWGVNSEKFPRYYNNEWVKFDNWVKENPFKILLKRELLKQDVSDTVQPIEYPSILTEYPLQTEEEFNNRSVEVTQYWGRSNEERIRIHGEIWLHAYNKGFQPCDNLYYVNHYLSEEKGRKWITMWIPHYARIDVSELMKINSTSKLSLSWAGAGFKCFRTAEAPLNSIMVMHKNNYAWGYLWDDTNCILVEPKKEIEGIENALKNPNLYEIYKKGVANSENYLVNNYIKNYIEPLINSI